MGGAYGLFDVTDLATLRAEGYRLQAQGRHAEAAARYEQVVAAAPDDWEIWNNLGNARRASGDPGGGCAALARAADLRPDEPGIHFNHGAALAGAGRVD